eukprot:7490634-Pyramimonas_sp.AAC.1
MFTIVYVQPRSLGPQESNDRVAHVAAGLAHDGIDLRSHPEHLLAEGCRDRRLDAVGRGSDSTPRRASTTFNFQPRG